MSDFCYVVVPGAQPGKRIGIVKRGESGYWLTDFDRAEHSEQLVESAVTAMNSKRGISPEQSEAMLIGSMFGWDVPGARIS